MDGFRDTSPREASDQGGLGRVLLVDDDPRFRTILKEFLELNHFTVVAVGTGEEALGSAAQSPPDVVLLDLRMPGMDGLLTMKHLKLASPNVPVIFITQDDQDDVKQEAMILGPSDYLLKPFSFEELKSILLLKIFS